MKNAAITLTFVLFLSILSPQISLAQEPTKEALIKTLSNVYELLEAGKFAESKKHFYIPEEFKGDFGKAAAGFIEKREISKDGIQILSESATFGPAVQIFGEERAKWIADRMKVDLENAWGFYHQTEEATGEVLAVWQNGEFKIGRLDDVGKLKLKDSSAGGTAALLKAALELESNRKFAESWTQLSKVYELGDRSKELKDAFDRSMSRFANAGIFVVGRSQPSTLKLLGKPHQIVNLGRDRSRWIYGSWGVDFHAGSLHGIIDLRGATKALFTPQEKISIDLPGDNWSTQFRDKRKGQVIAYLYTETYSRTWKEQFTVERFLDTAALTPEAFAQKQIQFLQTRNPESKHKFLAKEESSVIYAEEIPLKKEETSLHRLTRVLKGQQDIHKVTYTIRSPEAPSKETQMKWLEIFKKAKLEVIGKQSD